MSGSGETRPGFRFAVTTSASSVLYLLTPPRGSYMELLPELFEAGVDWLQYRRPHADDRVQLEELRQILPRVRRHEVRLFVNDRPDLALASGAEGVHLGAEDLPGPVVKDRFDDLVVGVTQRAETALPEGVDYYSVGPVFDPGSKQLERPPCGWEGVRGVIERTDRPVLAIAGITPERLEEMPPECAGIAVISAVWEAEDPVEAVRRLKNELKNR